MNINTYIHDVIRVVATINKLSDVYAKDIYIFYEVDNGKGVGCFNITLFGKDINGLKGDELIKDSEFNLVEEQMKLERER